MKIAFSGPQSTGKSTLLENCREIYGARFTYAEEITRKVANLGFKINENGDNTTQLLILNGHLQNSLQPNIIMDRCILDGVVYTHYLYNQNNVNLWVLDYAQHLYRFLIPQYDIVFYTHPDDVPLVDDGTRSINTQFRRDIIQLFDNYMSSNFIVLRGTVEQRLKIIKKAIQQHTNNL